MRARHRPQTRPSATPPLPSRPALPRESGTARAALGPRLHSSCIRRTDRFERTRRHDRWRLRCELRRARSWTGRIASLRAPRRSPAHSHRARRGRQKSGGTARRCRQPDALPYPPSIREDSFLIRILAFADDMTGALETGAKFSGAGIRAVVFVKPVPASAAPVVVFDTETRHTTPEVAAAELKRFVL